MPAVIRVQHHAASLVPRAATFSVAQRKVDQVTGLGTRLPCSYTSTFKEIGGGTPCSKKIGLEVSRFLMCITMATTFSHSYSTQRRPHTGIITIPMYIKSVKGQFG